MNPASWTFARPCLPKGAPSCRNEKQCWLARQFNLVGLSACASSGQALVSGGQLPALTPNDCLGPITQQPSKFSNPQAQQPSNPSGIHSLRVGLRAGAFMVRLASRAAQVRLCLLVRLTPHMPYWGGPLTPAALVFGSCAPPPMASIVRKQSLSRFSSELLDELSYCCQLAANPCLRLGALADEILIDRIRELPEPELDPKILALLPY